MTILQRLTDRLISLVGLDFDVIQMQSEHVNRIRDDLYLGARPEPKQIETLKTIGITHVVSCLAENERSNIAFLQPHFHTLFVPIRDGIHEDITSAFSRVSGFASTASAQKRNAKLFIHCQVGVSRSAALVIALLIERERKSFYDAYLDVQSKRSEALPNIGFASQLERFAQERLPNREGLCSLTHYLCEMCHVPVEKAVLQTMLEKHEYDAFSAITAIFGDDFPRVIQGVRK